MKDTKEHDADTTEVLSIKEAIDTSSNLSSSTERIDETAHQPVVYPGTAKLVLILSAVALSIFLFALDTSIISTAIPQITDEFHSLDDVAW